MSLDVPRLDAAYRTARDLLLAERHPDGYWVGELSSSALSTATAIAAFCHVQRHTSSDSGPSSEYSVLRPLVESGVPWLVGQQNADGGWGDTDRSLSNLSTTSLCRSALHLAMATASRGREPPVEACLQKANLYLQAHGGTDPSHHAEAIRRRYGKDRTFSVPILMTAALAGLIPWSEVPALPFELACFPQSWFRFLRLPVVSYALPALIAIGQAVHHHRQSWNPFTRLIRWLARKKSLRVLERIQPSSGGFLEATPLTSFVVMALASIGQVDHPVVKKGVEFLVNSVRPDGSWPIDSNLSVWVTTLSVNALAAAGELSDLRIESRLDGWLRLQQFQLRHPYTGAERGGWGWTHLPGSVPDGDDTPGALLAICELGGADAALLRKTALSADDGILWLLKLQNRDGGWPTFCRGWGSLPFDRSGPDLTAHVIRALIRWSPQLARSRGLVRIAALPFEYAPPTLTEPLIDHGLAYLARTQRPDGSWLPLWFGNQHAPNEENPTYGTARVLAAYRDLGMMDSEPARRGVAWLFDAQNPDGSWGGDKGVAGSVEESSLAVEILLDADAAASTSDAIAAAVQRGLTWLVEAVEAGRLKSPEPIGFYFAKLWYYEKLYPMIFAVAALGRARRKLAVAQPGG
jgi:squalene-hopene/tetraprenyl-beta-curcumene cyclase